MSKDIYELLSEERKHLQSIGEMPEWMTTGGYQLLKQKYLDEGQTPKQRYELISKTAAQYMPDPEKWEVKFFDLFWKGWLSPSTPILSNMGTNKGLSVSCSGGVIGDSIDDFYVALREAALLTKYGFGTSACLDDIRPRGSPISSGGKASGVLPVFDDFVTMTTKVAQGTARRGAWAGYLNPLHGDFDEVITYVENKPDDANIGWNITDQMIAQLDSGCKETLRRWQRTMKLKMTYGKGYWEFIDKVNRNRPQMYVDHGLYVRGSNLCSEIQLFADLLHTFTCVLSSMNLIYWDDWKDTDAVFDATVFLDCVAEDFIQKAKHISGLEKAVRFTVKGRALGLGTMALHSLFQKKRFPVDSVEAAMLNDEIFSHLNSESKRASRWMAEVLGEPEWCKGYGVRNTHTNAIAPTKSTALIMGGWSEGIGMDPAMVFNQTTAGGEIARINPFILEIMKERGVFNKKTINRLIDTQGSVQGESWLTDHEKKVFLTAFEIRQEVILSLASARQIYIDQGQSLNLYFSYEEDEAYIAYIHELAMRDPYIFALYYVYGQSGVQASKAECENCQ